MNPLETMEQYLESTEDFESRRKTIFRNMINYWKNKQIAEQ